MTYTEQGTAMHDTDSKDPGSRLFRFAVIADTHVNPEDGRSSSPFAVNGRANERAGAVTADVNRWAPSLVVHVGDLVHPVPELPSFRPACERFKSLARAVKAPLHVLSGNHDVGDKRVDWMPAGTVTQEAVEQYRSIFGRDFYSFDAEGCHFILINAQVINSGLPAEAEQRAWLEKDFSDNAGKRTFFFTHYPPYVSERTEPSNYDNIDEPGRTWLLDLIGRHQPEALFAGHVHNQWYDCYEHTELYILPSTAFVRQDYAELFKIGPLREYGRDDATKLGYYVVDVHERGHVAHFIRTNGAARAGEIRASAGAPESPVHTKTNHFAPVGVDMRHAWVEWIDVAATGGVQEFERKRTRNDYPALALWEMGVRKLRVPVQDLLDPPVRARMALLRKLGHRYTAYAFGVPAESALSVIDQNKGLIDGLEIVTTIDNAAAAMERMVPFKQRGLRVFLSKLRRHEDAKFDGSHFNHFINHGFVLAEHEQLEQLLALPAARECIDGFVVRVPKGSSPWHDLHASLRLADALRVRTMLQVRLAADNPAEPVDDDFFIANRVAETVFAALSVPQADVFFDTFVDVDRNYFPHHGFVDRRYDPRPASYVYRHLHAVLARYAGALEGHSAGVEDKVQWFAAQEGKCRWVLLTAAKPIAVRNVALRDPLGVLQSVVCIDLVSGAKQRASCSGNRVTFAEPVLTNGPVLLAQRDASSWRK